MVLQATSALYEPAAAPLVSSCLGSAGCRESHLRAFSPQIVATRLARLTKAGFVQESTQDVRGQKTRLWRCRPDVAEIAVRHAVRDGRFLPLAKAALTETRGRDWHGVGADDSPKRRFRLAFHAGDWRLAAKELDTLATGEPGGGGAFLAQLVKLQPDDSWRRTAKPAVFAPVLASALRQCLDGLVDAGQLVDLAKDIADRSTSATRPAVEADLLPILVETLVLKGKLKDAAKLSKAALSSNQDTAPYVPLPVAVAEGSPDIPDLVSRTLSRKRSGTPLLPAGSAAVWQALAVLSGSDNDAVDAMLHRLEGTAFQNHEYFGALTYLRSAFLFMVGQASAAKALLTRPDTCTPLELLTYGLAVLRVDPASLPPLAPVFRDFAARAKAGGYRWLASQYEALQDAATGVEHVPGRWPALTALFNSDDAWRRGLEALEELTGDVGDDDAPAGKRLAWLVSVPAQPDDPFLPFDVQPIEQTLTKDGSWSKGRNVALKRIFQHAADLNYVSDQDRMVFSTLRYDFGAMSQGFRFDIAAALVHLVGHPLVYRGDTGGAKIEIVPGHFELMVTDRDPGCEIAMEPTLRDLLPDDTGGQSVDVDLLPATLARFETPTRVRVFQFGGRERRLARVVGEGLAIPARGRDEALETLTKLSGSIRVQSDIPELAGEGEPIEADSRPRFHVIPQNVGLKVEVWVHPLGDDGTAYRPGRGGRILTGTVDDRVLRATRDLQEEINLVSAAVEACPALAGHEDGELSWSLDDPETALQFLAESEDLDGRAVLTWPKGGRFRVRRTRGIGGLRIRVNSSADWFELSGSLIIDENLVVDIQTLLASMKQSGGRFVQIADGEFVALTNELRRQLSDLEAAGDFYNGIFRLPSLAGAVLDDLEEAGADLEADHEWRRQLERRRELADFTAEVPDNFLADLRDYQLEGFRWMARLSEWGAGACLADDMGLGKTVQALAMLARRGSLGPALVVAPTSVCHNWISETAKFAPGLRMRPFSDNDREAHLGSLGPGDVLITSYSLLRQEDELLSKIKWATVVLDEAQAIKNVSAKRSKAAMSLDASFRLITTGTPIENHLGELWNLFRFINPSLLGSWRRFQERFAVPIERMKDEQAGDRLRRLIRPFILRRTKSQVLHSLPPKTEITLAVELGDRERAFYESLRRGALERLDSDPASPEKKRFQILAEIMRLRRACCAPELVTGGEGIVSAKQEQFRETLEELVDNNHKVLVFSQFVDHLHILRRYLDERNFSYQYLDGGTPARQRKKAVEDFQSGIGDVFLISLRAGGLGLNLTAADYVIHMDPWWNPAVEDQASDRAHRIGQEKPVTVYRLVAASTIEEKIVQLHQNKRDLADSLLSGADQSASLDMDEILQLLRSE